LRARCHHSLEPDQCRQALHAIGLTYGEAYSGLEAVGLGTDPQGQRFVLAEVRVPASVADPQERYGIHPSALDCALQASIALVLDGPEFPVERARAQRRLPFALSVLRVFDR